MITAIVLFLLASLIALNVARRHEIGRKYVTPPNPWANATAPATATQAPASDRRSRLVAIGPVHAGEPPRPARGDPTKMTSLRGMQEDHIGADRTFHEITVHAHQANPGPSGRDAPRRLPVARPRGTSATEPVGRIRRRHRTYPHREPGSSWTSGRREATRGQALVRSSRRPPGGHPAV
jgi:hypothetical protein